MKIYAIATLKNENSGHGDYRSELSICQYLHSVVEGIGMETFHPAFKDKGLAQKYLDELKWNHDKKIVELELIEI